jgi:shikimate dehydrogenase
MITGKTTLIAHVGYPIDAFKAPLIYNPYFEQAGIDAVVVPMGIEAADYPTVLRPLFRLTNILGALVTMPHKVTTVALLDEVSTAVKVAGSCNAILRRADGSLLGDVFDGVGFTRGLKRKNFKFEDASCLVVGTGGVGSAIAASIAGEGVAKLFLSDINGASAEALASRIKHHHPKIESGVRTNDPSGYQLVVNATPLGMMKGDPCPIDVTRLSATTFVGEVVMKQEITPLLQAAREKGCKYQVGTDMLFEQIPAYLEFFGLGTATADELRAASKLAY